MKNKKLIFGALAVIGIGVSIFLYKKYAGNNTADNKDDAKGGDVKKDTTSTRTTSQTVSVKPASKTLKDNVVISAVQATQGRGVPAGTGRDSATSAGQGRG